jgi:methylase of polypeptide subunit release factors
LLLKDEISLLDIGCGVGNSFYPLIDKKKNLKVNAFDVSKRAVNLAKVNHILLK